MSGSLEAANPWLKDLISTVKCNQWSDLGVKVWSKEPICKFLWQNSQQVPWKRKLSKGWVTVGFALSVVLPVDLSGAFLCLLFTPDGITNLEEYVPEEMSMAAEGVVDCVHAHRSCRYSRDKPAFIPRLSWSWHSSPHTPHPSGSFFCFSFWIVLLYFILQSPSRAQS